MRGLNIAICKDNVNNLSERFIQIFTFVVNVSKRIYIRPIILVRKLVSFKGFLKNKILFVILSRRTIFPGCELSKVGELLGNLRATKI